MSFLAYKTLNAMKKRRGGFKHTRREQLISHRRHTCPGWMGHNNPRRDRIFNRHSGIKYRHGHLAYAMYWRLHTEKEQTK